MPIGRSEFVRVRGLRLHVRRFGCTQSPVLIVLHGWMDASGSFVPLIKELLSHFAGRLQVIAPDWRGHGYSEWSQNGYSVADYVADLDALFGHYTGSQSTVLVGHSMGAHVAALYAGLRPQKISGLACLDGFNLPDTPLSLAPSRYRRWLDQTKNPPKHEVYPDFETLARRIVRHHPRLSLPQARCVARCWAAEVGNGQVRLLADPLHRLRGPGLYRVSDSEVIWQLVCAPTLLLQSGESEHRDAISVAERQRRHSCFRNRRLEVLPGIGHMLHFEDPQRTARSLANFLSEVFQ